MKKRPPVEINVVKESSLKSQSDLDSRFRTTSRGKHLGYVVHDIHKREFMQIVEIATLEKLGMGPGGRN